MDESEAVCWICLGGPQSPCNMSGQATSEQQGSRLVKVCACPRPVHRECLARWQLQQAGRSEERYCRFCNKEYPDWKDALTPIELRPTTPIMAVSVRGRVHKLRVKPGPEGKEDFKRQVRQLLGYDDSMEFDVIFECKTPHSGEKVQLHGFSAFDAATHCAAVSAAKRLRNKQSKRATDHSSAASCAPVQPSTSALDPVAHSSSGAHQGQRLAALQAVSAAAAWQHQVGWSSPCPADGSSTALSSSSSGGGGTATALLSSLSAGGHSATDGVAGCSRTRLNGSNRTGSVEGVTAENVTRQASQAAARVPYRRSLSCLQRHTELYMAQQQLTSAAAVASASLLDQAMPVHPKHQNTPGNGSSNGSSSSSRTLSSSTVSSASGSKGTSRDVAFPNISQCSASVLKPSITAAADFSMLQAEFPSTSAGSVGLQQGGPASGSAAWLPAPISVNAAVANLSLMNSLSPAPSDPDAFAAATLHATAAAAGPTLPGSSTSSAPPACCDSLVSRLPVSDAHLQPAASICCRQLPPGALLSIPPPQLGGNQAAAAAFAARQSASVIAVADAHQGQAAVPAQPALWGLVGRQKVSGKLLSWLKRIVAASKKAGQPGAPCISMG